ncbi:MAG: alpha/beta fold hydrolase [Actinomycetota bacterium]
MDEVTSNDGTTIAFDRYGAGPAIILVGGAFQHRAIDPQTKRLAELLAPSFTVFHYDRRGRGESGDTLPYAIEREVEDIAALIDEAGGSAHAFGMSSGGVLVLEAAASGLPVTKLALYEPPWNVEESRRTEMQAYSRQLTTLLAEGRRGDAAALAMTTFGAPPEAVEGMRQAPVWAMFESVAPTLAYDAAAMGDYSVPIRRAATVTVPAMVLDGGASPPWLGEAADAVAAALPSAQRRTLEGQTHDVSPEVLAPALHEFFAA